MIRAIRRPGERFGTHDLWHAYLGIPQPIPVGLVGVDAHIANFSQRIMRAETWSRGWKWRDDSGRWSLVFPR